MPLRTAKSQRPSISDAGAPGLLASALKMFSSRRMRSWLPAMISAVRAEHFSAATATAASGVLLLSTSISA